MACGALRCSCCLASPYSSPAAPTPKPPTHRPVAPPITADATAGSETARTRDFGEDDAPYAIVKVFYATDRAKTGNSAPNDRYGVARGKLVYGVADISIPRDHRMGTLEGPAISKLEFRENPESHVVLMAVAERDRSTFFRELQQKLAASPKRNALVFIHGYNITFAEAARRTGQLAYDLAFDGAPLFYSWPSQGNVPGYVIDANNSDWTVTHLKGVITGLVERSGADNVYVIAHSLGSRALVEAVSDLKFERPGVRAKIREVILAAPDIDTEIFVRDIAPRIAGDGIGVTLYASGSDKAMIASRNLHGYPRAGDFEPGPRHRARRRVDRCLRRRHRFRRPCLLWRQRFDHLRHVRDHPSWQAGGRARQPGAGRRGECALLAVPGAGELAHGLCADGS